MFVDLVGWTELAERTDPELLQRVLDDYYALCSDTVRAHGGVVEKFIGDAVMAVFGIPASHESDAEQALLAAQMICAGVAGVEGTTAKLDAHAGIAAGEALVLSSTASSVRVVGDTVNLAARLQSASIPGQILINDTVRRLLRNERGLRAAPELTLKGKAAPVRAWEVSKDWQAPTGTASDDHRHWFVGRERERQVLRNTHRLVCQTARTQVVYLLGPPGIGKTSLWKVALDGFPYAAAACSVPGRAGTYAPAYSLLHSLTPTRDLGAAVIPEELSFMIAECVLLRAPEGRPALIWDDIHWADAKLLDLIADVVARLAAAGVLVICAGRSGAVAELTGTSGVSVHTVELSRLDAHDITMVTQHHLGRSVGANAEVVAQRSELDLVQHVSDASGGNPLFAELLVEAISLGNGLDPMPFTLIAVISATLDRLPDGARLLLEQVATAGLCASVSALDLLGADQTYLEELVDRQILGQQGAQVCFPQQVVHDVVYQRAHKSDRMAWHLVLGGAEFSDDSASAFHLESAARLGVEIRPDAPELPVIRSRAVSAMLGVGTSALRNRDLPYAISLFSRGIEIAADEDPNLGVMTVRLSDAWFSSGDIAAAAEVVSPGNRSATAEQQCSAQALMLAQRIGHQVLADIDQLRTTSGDLFTQCRVDQADALRHLADGRLRDAERRLESARQHAAILADSYEEDRVLIALCEIGQWSPRPIDGKLELCRHLSERFADDRILLVPVQVAMARHLILLRRYVEAKSALATARQTVADLQLGLSAVLIKQTEALLASVQSQTQRARDLYASAADALEAFGHGPSAATLRALSLREDLRSGRSQAVDAWLHDMSTQAGTMEVRGLLVTSALRLQRAAATDRSFHAHIFEIEVLLDRTDDLCLRGDILLDMARAHREADQVEGSEEFAHRALAEYDQLGATALIEKVHTWLTPT